MREGEDDLLIGDRLAVSAEQFVHVLAAEFRQVPVVRRVGLGDAVERPRVFCQQRALLAARGEHVHFCAQRHADLRDALGHTDRVREHAARAELEILHLARRGDAVE